MLRTTARCPTSVEIGPAYSAAPVSIKMPNSAAFTQCTVRSTRSNRRNVGAGSGCIVVAPVRTSDPPVDVVAAYLPVALLDVLREHDAVEPLQRFVAVHRRDIQADRAAVLVGQW